MNEVALAYAVHCDIRSFSSNLFFLPRAKYLPNFSVLPNRISALAGANFDGRFWTSAHLDTYIPPPWH